MPSNLVQYSVLSSAIAIPFFASASVKNSSCSWFALRAFLLLRLVLDIVRSPYTVVVAVKKESFAVGYLPCKKMKNGQARELG